jgi:DNA-binding MarR family transcriptional regulator
VLTGRYQTVKEIAEASAMTTSRVKAHVGYLVQRGHVEKSDKGYKVAKKK